MICSCSLAGHLLGDFVAQTNWQAGGSVGKVRFGRSGCGDTEIGITRCPETLHRDQVWNHRRW